MVDTWVNCAFRNKGLSLLWHWFLFLLIDYLTQTTSRRRRKQRVILLDSLIRIESEISWLHYMAPEASWLPWQRGVCGGDRKLLLYVTADRK